MTIMVDLLYYLSSVLTVGLILYIAKSIYAKTVSRYFPRYAYRFGSFAPIRKNCQVKWFVDGQDYMSAVGDAILGASKEILITSWQLNPCMLVKRPEGTQTDYEKWQLDKVLLRKADEGVTIHILLFNDASNISSMIKEHCNITVSYNDELILDDNNTFSDRGLNYTDSAIMAHHEKFVVIDRAVAFVGGIDFAFGEQHHVIEYPVTDSNSPNTHYIDKTYQVPTSHNVACCFNGPAVDDFVKHFNQRLQVTHNELPWGGNYLSNISKPDYSVKEPNSFSNVNLQVLRSVSKWSTHQPYEDSIHQAILSIIKNSKHFIYVETQFLISSHPGYIYKVRSELLNALAERITQAYKKREDFCVIFIMPLKPDFGGNTKTVVSWNYDFLYTGKNSLYSRLKANGIPEELIGQYLSVYGLRKHDTRNKKYITEVVYIHSKLIIVDDRISIVGSANINNPTLLGDRDSDVSVIIEDTEMIPGTMNGQPFQVGKFSHSLRCHLYREHLDLLDDTKYETSTLKVDDPMSIRTQLNEMATRNTAIYEHVFGDNDTWALQDRKYVANDSIEMKREIDTVRGKIVKNQLLFLKDF